MLHRRLAPPLALALIAGLTACSPSASPDPTPTYRQFSSEEEAFEAAEETYRAYTSAVDAFYAGDDSADPLVFLTGEALRIEKQAQEFLRKKGLVVEGASQISDFSRTSVSLLAGAAQVEATACLDTSNKIIRNREGEEHQPEASPIFLQMLKFTSVEGKMLIYQSDATDRAC